MINLIDPHIEEVFKRVILVDLDNGRRNFDRPHTEAVVYWMNRLLSNLNYSESINKIMLTAAYAHDWGYVGLFDGINSSDINQIHKMKPLHMKRGAEKIFQLINESTLKNSYLRRELDLVVHLVLVHDNIEDLRTNEEILIMEADTMGMLDADRVEPTFTKEDNDIFMIREIFGRRLPKFKHEFAIEKVKDLVKKRNAFYLPV